jgi:prophage antirepressor-like protein
MNEDLFTTVVAANAQSEVTSTIIPFDFNGNQVRIMKDDHDEPLFVAKDVADILGYRNASDMTRRLDDEEKGTRKTRTLGGMQDVTVINESGLYSAILGSNKPEAKAFKRWVTSEVLPSIRKHGGYIHAAPGMSDEEIMARGIMIANATIERQKMRIAEQEKQLQLQAPAVEYCNDVLSASNLHTVNSIAVHMGVSAKRLNQFLVEQDWIYKQGEIYCPSCKIRGKGYCDYHVVPYINRNGDKMTREHLKWTETGRRAIVELWNRHFSKKIA